LIENATLILGPPGCGKTYSLIQKVKDKLEEGTHPSRIGVVSFTTKAIGEFVERACTEFNLIKDDFPHFRTLHATGYHGLGLQKSDVMGRKAYTELGKVLGLDFFGADAASVHDGVAVPSIGGSGAKYLQLVMRSTYREKSLEYEYNYEEDYSLHYEKLVQVNDQIEDYKANNLSVDFADMIKNYVLHVDTPHLDLLIVDEAQDLTPLQWTMVEKMSKTAEEVLIAGDDDQAIHRWTGVDIGRFMKSSAKVEVLSQSFRLPVKVWSLAKKISSRIEGRFEKEFLPKEDEGFVTRVGSIWGLPLDQGSWTIMARINGYVDDIAEDLEEMGYFYSRKGKTPVTEESIKVMGTWNDLSQGKSVGSTRIKEFYQGVPKMGDNAVVKRGSIKLFDAADAHDVFNYDLLVKEYGLIASLGTDPMDIARLSEDQKVYLRQVERKGESIYEPARIKLSTIHAMKGGEDDNVAVYTGSTRRCMEGKHPEDEDRVFYVAVTRAKQNLYLIESDKKYRYEI
tara:strand:+ start:2492 stop:4021 length:1530 start_codon:yes stop_codon:yes gene_type:complete